MDIVVDGEADPSAIFLVWASKAINDFQEKLKLTNGFYQHFGWLTGDAFPVSNQFANS